MGERVAGQKNTLGIVMTSNLPALNKVRCKPQQPDFMLDEKMIQAHEVEEMYFDAEELQRIKSR